MRPAAHDILLVAFNARYGHCGHAVRSLLANLGPWRDRAAFIEYDATALPFQVAADLDVRQPRMVGFSVYLWNVRLVRETCRILALVAPRLRVVLGGPELDGAATSEWAGLADALVIGDGETALRDLAAAWLEQERPARPPEPVVIRAAPAAVDDLLLPAALYREADLRQRTVYTETSRGCPGRCRYCTSCDRPLRLFPEATVQAALSDLLDRGARQIKFLDRCFNVPEERAVALLHWLAGRGRRDLRLHFEILPGRIGPHLLDALASFPAGALHLEVGVQTLNPDAGRRAGRPFDPAAVLRDLGALQRTGADLHADLIAGLPGEDAASFGRGFDRLFALGLAELQVSLLKGLPGTPLLRETAAEGLGFSPVPPYEVLFTDALDFAGVAALQRFARGWDLFGNRPRFRAEMDRLRTAAAARSPFEALRALSERVYMAEGRLHALSEERLARHLEASLAQ